MSVIWDVRYLNDGGQNDEMHFELTFTDNPDIPILICLILWFLQYRLLQKLKAFMSYSVYFAI